MVCQTQTYAHREITYDKRPPSPLAEASSSKKDPTIMKRQGLWAAAILVTFGIIYTLMSVGNHLCFRTSCLDLGQYTNVIYDYAHLHMDDCSAYLAEPRSNLADHFDLYLIILAPFYYLFGIYTLLIFQILGVLVGGWGIYRLIRSYSSSPLLPLLAMVSLMAFYGVWHALSFEYHSTVIASMLIPWLLLFIRQRRFGLSSLFVILISIAKETMPLWLFFISLALLWDYRKEQPTRRWLMAYMAYSLLYFVIIGMVVMPLFGSNDQVIWRYRYMGDSFGAIALHMATHPWSTLVNFFSNFTHDADYDHIKLQFCICTVLSGGWLLLARKPHWLLMMAPSLAMKMLARDAGFWGITFHYNVEFAPVLVCGAFIILSEMKQQRLQTILACCTTGLLLLTTSFTTSKHAKMIRKQQVRILDKRHYRQDDFDAAYARKLLREIPSDASVSATSLFVPHLADRDSVYMFPCGADLSQYILVLDRHWAYHEGDEERIASIIDDTLHFETLSTNGNLYLIRRR